MAKTTKTTSETNEASEQRKTTAIRTIEDQVKQRLGTADNFDRIKAHKVDLVRYRVNVYHETKREAMLSTFSGLEIAHSYFVTTNDDNLIVHSDPPITKTY